MRGKAEPLAAWRLVAHPRAAGLRTWARCRAASPSYADCARPSSASPTSAARSASSWSGPAGIGKSRLAREVGDALRRARHRAGRPLPPLRRGHHVLGAGARSCASWPASADPRAALEAALADDPRAELLADRVLQAAGLEEATAAREDLTGAVRDLFAALARARPVVLVLEDLHWAEPALLDLIEHLLEHTADAPLMLVCLAREELIEQRPRWARETHDSSLLELGPLSPADTRALIRQLLPAERGLGRRCASSSPTRAEGNPLFLQQMIAFLRETGDRRDVSVPPTIQALLAARLDRLSAPPSGARSAPPRSSAASSGARRWQRSRPAMEMRHGVARDAHAQAARRAGAVDPRGRDGLRLQPHPGPRRGLRVDHQGGPRRAARAARGLARAAPSRAHDRDRGDARPSPRAGLPATAPTSASWTSARSRSAQRAARAACLGRAPRRARARGHRGGRTAGARRSAAAGDGARAAGAAACDRRVARGNREPHEGGRDLRGGAGASAVGGRAPRRGTRAPGARARVVRRRAR